MTGNTKVWRAPLAGLAAVAMLATMGVAASTANAATDDPNKPNVTLDANGWGSFSGDHDTYTVLDATTGDRGTKIDSAKLDWNSVNVPTADAGYTFTGWYLGAEKGSQKFDFDNTVLTDDVTLYAHWAKTANLKTVKFNDGAYGQKSATTDPSVTDSGTVVTVSRIAPGDVLASWQQPADVAGDSTLIESWNNGSSKFDLSTPVRDDLTLTPQKTDAVSVTFDSHAVTGTSRTNEVVDVKAGATLSDPYILSEGKSKIVTEWTAEDAANAAVWDFGTDTVPAGKKTFTLNAKTGDNTTKITFTGYGDVYVASSDAWKNRVPTLGGTYYTKFLGWDAKNNHNANVDDPVSNYTGTIAAQLTVKTFYPEFEQTVKHLKTFTLDENWDDAPKPYDVTVDVDSYPSLPDPKTSGPEGYSFKEWNTKANGSGVTVDSDYLVKSAGNTTLYAIWTKDATADSNAVKLFKAWGYPLVETTSAQKGRVSYKTSSGATVSNPTGEGTFTEKSLDAYKTVVKDIFQNDLNSRQRDALNAAFTRNGFSSANDVLTDAQVKKLDEIFPNDDVAAKALSKLEAAQAGLEFNQTQTVYRLYDQHETKKHLYTTDRDEYLRLLVKGWRDETKVPQGRFSVAPYGQGSAETQAALQAGFIKPTYRVYLKFDSAGRFVNRHFYTSVKSEYEGLVKQGWRDEGIAWYYRTQGGTPVYRTYSRERLEHLYTASKAEADNSVALYGYRWDKGYEVAFNSAD